jgi:isoleucyl-tRNA synthetase
MKAQKPGVQFPELEERVLSFWEKNDTFQESNRIRDEKNSYTFYDGPPFANGLPHYGHLLANTIKDTVPRYWNMRGYRVERRFGWDCHGFPVETEIEKKEGLKGRPDILAMGIAEFNEKCRSSVKHYTGEWQKTVTRLGRWVDWDNQYHTMDPSFMESVWWVLSELNRKKLFYRDHKIVPYSPRLSAVLSNFEANQNYKDVQDPAITAKFKLVDEQAYILAWTTTPWTLISNLALAVGPDIEYVKVKHEESGEHYYLAEARLDAIFPSKKGKPKPYEVIARVRAKDLVGRSYEPLFPYFKDQENAFVVLADDYVTTSDGTGVVHQAPAYGEDDFRVCKLNGIELVDPLNEEGEYTEMIPEYKGQFVKDADKDIIKDLKQKNLLLKHETIVHSYPHCERTEGPLIYRAIPAWYIKVEDIKDKLVKNNKTINWVPSHLRDGRMGQWLENARDWAISRNRFWGTPIPVWVSDDDPDHFEVIGSVAELEEKSGAKVDDLHKHFIDDITYKDPKTGSIMRRIPEVFDCWFESGSMPYAQMHYPFENKETLQNNFPADFIAEGLDQTRGWFYTLSILSEALFGKPAFKNVVVNGLVLAGDGKKMSKRLGNYTPPIDLLDKYGADSVRLYMLNSPILKAEPLRFKDEGVKDTTRTVLLPLWNAFSFLTTYAAADGWQPTSELASGKAPKLSHEMDRWIISRLQSLAGRVHKQMEGYYLYLVVPEVLEFIDELTNWYIRLSRRRFWDGGKDEEGGQEAYSALYFVLVEFTKIMAPFAPFISEKIYQELTDGIEGVKQSVHLCDMPVANSELIEENLEKQMSLLQKAAGLARSLRAKHQIKTRQVLSEMTVIVGDESEKAAIEKGKALLISEINLKSVVFSDDEVKYLDLSLKPNLKTLGRRLGKRLGEFRKSLAEINQDQAKVAELFRKLENDQTVTLLGESFDRNDFLIERGPKGEMLIATEAGITVLLDTHLTPELIREGLAREVINRIQKMRKDGGLEVADRITVHLAADESVTEAVRDHEKYICDETLTNQLELSKSVGEVDGAVLKESFEIDGASCNIGISRI